MPTLPEPSLFVSDKNNTKLSLEVFMRKFQPLVPSNVTITDKVKVDGGFIIKFSDDQNVNFAFTPDVISTLSSNNLVAKLTKAYAKARNIYCPDIPELIFNKDASEIIAEIHAATNMQIIHSKTFQGKTGRKYLVITADSKTDRNNLLHRQTITLFGQNVKLEAPLDRSDNDARPLPGHPRRADHFRPTPPRDHLSYPAWQHPRANERSYPTPPSTHGGEWPPLPNLSQPFVPPRMPQHHINHTRAPNFNNDSDIKFYIHATTAICKILNEGMLDPIKYIADLNETFASEGLPHINIPYNQLIQSRHIFMRNKPAYIPFQNNNHPYSPSRTTPPSDPIHTPNPPSDPSHQQTPPLRPDSIPSLNPSSDPVTPPNHPSDPSAAQTSPTDPDSPPNQPPGPSAAQTPLTDPDSLSNQPPGPSAAQTPLTDPDSPSNQPPGPSTAQTSPSDINPAITPQHDPKQEANSSPTPSTTESPAPGSSPPSKNLRPPKSKQPNK